MDFAINVIKQMRSAGDIRDLLSNAVEPGLKPIQFPKTEAELEAEMHSIQEDPRWEELESDLYTRSMLSQIPIPDTVRRELQAEMAARQKRGWL